MRRHAVSTMYNNFICKYINLFFEKDILRTDLQGKQKNSCTELLVTIIN